MGPARPGCPHWQWCVQAGHSPYRESKLTMLLKDTLAAESARPRVTCVVATVSPCSVDTEHSLNTLRTACAMAGADIEPSEASTFGISEVVVRLVPPLALKFAPDHVSAEVPLAHLL